MPLNPSVERPLSVAWSISSDRQPDALEGYRTSFAEVYEIRDIAPVERKPFHSRTRVFRFGESVLGQGNSVAQTFVRSPTRIRRSGLDHVGIVINQHGGVGEFEDRNIRIAPGDVQFRDLGRPAAYQADGINLINLITPRDMLPAWFLNRKFHGLTLPANSPGGRLVASHLSTLAAVGDDLTEDEGIAAVDATFVIAERFMGRPGDPTPLQQDAIQRTVRRRAIQIFDARLGHGAEPSVSEVAAAIGVSRSSLYRAFEALGGVRTYFRNRRLDRLFGLLRAGHVEDIEILLARHGYPAVQFRADFRRRYGFAPAEIEAAAYRAPGTVRMDAQGYLTVAAHDVFIAWLRMGRSI